MAMEFGRDFTTPYPHELGLPSDDLQQQHLFQDFEQQQLSSLSDSNSAVFAMSNSTPGQRGSVGDVKPRLTKEQHDILEAHYQKQQKPNTSTKRGFAESLNVSLEKNWFQNRRAKSKQDAKKQQGAVGVFDINQPDLGLAASDSETSPAFASAEYQQMMQHFAEDEASDQQTFEMSQPQTHTGPAYEVPRTYSSQLMNSNLLQAMAGDLMLPPQDENRRTLTQAQFDLLNSHDIMLNSGDIAMLSQDPAMLERLLAMYSQGSNQPALSLSMPAEPVVAVPIATNPAMLSYPFARMEEQVGSTSSSDWTSGSRSSSVSLAHSADLSTSLSSQQSLGQWQPGQSVPVDVHQLNEEFQKAAQAGQEQVQFTETPIDQQLAWTMDGLPRRDSSASLVQSMGNVGLQTPVQTQTPTFKSPTPTSSLAARRQRQRPTPLGLASLRSQSYSGSNPAQSPSHNQQHSLNAAPQLRRIKSSNVVGGISTGRVQKNIAMPQRSPLGWTFQDALNSPQAVRHPAPQTATLAPPTPMSPPDQTVASQSQLQQFQQQWQSASGQVMQQDTISETDAEHAATFMPPSASVPTFSSPPHTPMFHNQPQQFLPPQMVPGAMIMENTPPQSAPASQQCFSQSMFGPPSQQTHCFQQPPQMMQVPVQQTSHQIMQPQHFFVSQAPQQPIHAVAPPQFVTVMPPEQQMQMQMPQTSMPAGPQFTVTTSGPPQEMPMHFAQHGVPIVDASGQIQMALPSQMQFVSQKPAKQEHQAPKQQPKFSPGGTQLVFASNPNDTILQTSSQSAKHTAASSDFFVHEYTPPQDLKLSASPRRTVDTGPKNYTFANQTPSHFEKATKKTDTRSSSNSPVTASL